LEIALLCIPYKEIMMFGLSMSRTSLNRMRSLLIYQPFGTTGSMQTPSRLSEKLDTTLQFLNLKVKEEYWKRQEYLE